MMETYKKALRHNIVHVDRDFKTSSGTLNLPEEKKSTYIKTY